MSISDWCPLSGVDLAQLSEARLQAHYAAQWLARVARAYVPARPDDSHTNLGWSVALGGFTTHPLPDRSQIGLRIADLVLVLLETRGGEPQFLLDGRTNAQARAWLAQQMSAKSLDARALDAPSPYEMPAHPVAGGAAYATAAISDALGELAKWYANANHVLGRMQQQLRERKLDAPPVRCWPHHFDLDTLIAFGADRSMGVGFSPGDEYYKEPYFYVSLNPAPDVATLPRLPAIGHWHTHEFTAAVATASRIVAVKDQKPETEAFLSVATETGIKALA